MTYPKATLATLEALYRLGANICDEIQAYRPNLVIGLAHSGWMPVVVAQTLWAERTDDPFPPSTRTNIGLEKHEIYTTQYGKSPPAFCCGECCEGSGRLGHYLAWAAEQAGWLKTLREQIEAIFPSIPGRILVVDDIFGGYRSGYLSMALLGTLYPGLEVQVYAGHNDLTDEFVSGWMEEFAPALITGIPDGNRSSRQRYRDPWQKMLKPLITGTEDITPESLDWKPIDADSPAIKALTGHVPVEVALAAPKWAKTLACSYALQRLKGEINPDEIIDPGEDMDHLFPISHLRLEPADHLSMRAWLRGGVTRTDIAEVYGAGIDELKRGLKDVGMKDEWQSQGDGEAAIHFPLASLEPWTNAYYPPERPKADITVKGFDEFLPGDVWGGVHPNLYDETMESAMIKELLDAGIDTYIDLTNHKDLQRKYSYRKTLFRISHAAGKLVEIKVLPLPFHTAPDRAQVQRIIRFIHRSLRAGKHIYIHAGYNLEGRTVLILACLLIQRGYSAEKALSEVNAFWSRTLQFLIRSPLSEEQENFILKWQGCRV